MNRSPRTEVTRRLTSAPLALVVAVLLLMPVLLWVGVDTADAVARQTLTAPTEGQVLDGTFDVVVLVTPDEGELIEGVDARVRGSSQRSLSLEPVGDPQPDGTQQWQGRVDPLGGLALANGDYDVQVSVRPIIGDPTSFMGHGVRLAVPPPQTQLNAEPRPDEAMVVDLSWEPVALPDFIAYRIQRRSDAPDGVWATVTDLSDPRQVMAVDDVETPGAYRYRLIVVRGDGRGRELFATSDPRGVRANPDAPGTFTPPRDPDPQPDPGSQPAPDGGPRPVTRPTDVAQGGVPGPAETATAQSTEIPAGGAGGRPPVIRVPVQPAPPAPPRPVPLNDGVFEEILPFGDPSTEVTVNETETSFRDGVRSPGGVLNSLTEEDAASRAPRIAIAAGLILLVGSAHLRRWVSAASGR